MDGKKEDPKLVHNIRNEGLLGLLNKIKPGFPGVREYTSIVAYFVTVLLSTPTRLFLRIFLGSLKPPEIS